MTDPHPTPRPLDGRTREALLRLMMGGGSLQAACGRLGVEIDDVRAAADEDPRLAQRLRRCRTSMADNVLSRMYLVAMDGSVPAASLFLKHVPPKDAESSDAPEDDLHDADHAKLRQTLAELDDVCRRLEIGDPPAPGAAG